MNPRQKAIIYADKEFSLYIRARDGNRCLICSRIGNTDCAHYISVGSGSLLTRWDEMNGNAVCRDCHQKDHNGSGEYREALKRRHGDHTPEYLRRLGNRVVKLSAAEITDIGRMYKDKRKAL